MGSGPIYVYAPPPLGIRLLHPLGIVDFVRGFGMTRNKKKAPAADLKDNDNRKHEFHILLRCLNDSSGNRRMQPISKATKVPRDNVP